MIELAAPAELDPRLSPDLLIEHSRDAPCFGALVVALHSDPGCDTREERDALTSNDLRIGRALFDLNSAGVTSAGAGASWSNLDEVPGLGSHQGVFADLRAGWTQARFPSSRSTTARR